jgi:hypothetical protein
VSGRMALTLPTDFIVYNSVNVLAILMPFQGRFRNVKLRGCSFKPRSPFLTAH